MPSVTIDGSALHYLDQGTGVPVLLGHSYLWDAAMWAPQIEALARDYRVIVPDLWGHGGSGPMPADTHTLADLAGQMDALLQQLEMPPCHVIGLSVGGMWGAELALRCPQRVRSLVMMDTYVGPEPEAMRLRYFGMLDAIEAAGTIAAPLIEQVVPIFFRPGFAADWTVAQGFAKALAEMPVDRLRESVVPLGRMIFGRTDTRPQLSQLDPAYTLMACGEYDIPRPPKEMQEMAERVGCAITQIPDAGHISSLENPEFVTQMLRDWLQRH